MPPKDIVWNCNKQVVRNPIKFVWASDESQSALIKKQMSVDARHDRTFFGESRVSDDIEIAPLVKRLKLANAAS
jgi:hypothetical protein